MNRFYVPEHCSTQLRVLGMVSQLRWIIEGTISKEVELIDIHVISRFITKIYKIVEICISRGNLQNFENFHEL